MRGGRGLLKAPFLFFATRLLARWFFARNKVRKDEAFPGSFFKKKGNAKEGRKESHDALSNHAWCGRCTHWSTDIPEVLSLYL